MIPLQTTAFLIGIIAIYLSFLYYKRKEFNKFEFLFWAGLWIGFIFVVLFPHTLDFLLKTFSITRTMDLVMIIAFIIIFSLAFHNYIANSRIGKKIERMVRNEALQSSEDFENK